MSALTTDVVTGASPGHGTRCGWGLQSRNVSCVLFPTWPRVLTEPEQCSDQIKPSHERLCAVRCGQDCELGAWGAWSVCVRSCGQDHGVSTRVRRVITPPTGTGQHCPPRVQRRQCWSGVCGHDTPLSLPLQSQHLPPQITQQQRHVTVYVGAWSNCSITRSRRDAVTHVNSYQNTRHTSITEVSFHSSAPDIGQMTREVLCRGEGGDSIGWSNCMDGSRATVVPADKHVCIMDRDCHVSQWSSWTRDARSEFCETRETRERGESRSRHVVSLNVGGGRPCPHLSETRPGSESVECQLRYQWKIGSWSQCQVITRSSSSSSCGGGVMTRNLTCFDVSRGRPAEPVLCHQNSEAGPGRSSDINLVKRFVATFNFVINLSH